MLVTLVGSFGWWGGGGPRLGGSGGLSMVGSLGFLLPFTWRCVASEGFRLPSVRARLGSSFLNSFWRGPVALCLKILKK